VKVLIADDEPIARQVLREHVESIPGLKLVGEASTGKEAVERILALGPDLVFLDLHMPELDGLSAIRSLKGERTPLVIFVTAYHEYAVEAFELEAVDYLLKPVRRERLEKAVEKARRKAALPVPPESRVPLRNKKVVGRRGSDLYLLDPSEIIAFQAEGELVYIVTSSDRYFSDDSLKSLEQKLEQPRFRRVHRSTIVNTDQIRKISRLSSKRWLLQMSNGFEAIVSKRLGSEVRSQGQW
jgi:DNA-binding LytR/AlgR family response regulator